MSLNGRDIAQLIYEHDYSQFYGVPDSLLEPILENLILNPNVQLQVCSNEGQAIAQAAGYYLASNRPAVVFLQNSGLGHIVNPYTSLLCPEVMNIPVLLLIGWRHSPATTDEPQHRLMGKITTDLLRLMGLDYKILSTDNYRELFSEAQETVVHKKKSLCILIPKDLKIQSLPRPLVEIKHPKRIDALLSRYQFLEYITKRLPDVSFVATTGKTSRELFLVREASSQEHRQDLKVVGAMGCSASIAAGLTDANPNLKICILDGDGAVLMQMGCMAVIGSFKKRRLLHIIFANNVHDSTGGQALPQKDIPFEKIATDFNYQSVHRVATIAELEQVLSLSSLWYGPTLIVVAISAGSKERLGRPSITPAQNAEDFMFWLRED